MQDDLAANFPSLDIQIIGINERGHEVGNAGFTAGRDLPWLQDVDGDSNGSSDTWFNWAITFRDVILVDENNEQVGVYNLTNNDLANAANYNTLRQMFVDAASTTSTPPEINVADASLTEGDLGTSTLTFTVTLSSASTDTVTVNYATADGTALANSDYAAKSNLLSFDPGVTSRTVSITILDDRTWEADETFTLSLTGAVNATINDGQATGAILNNDAVPTVMIGDQTVVEGDSGATSGVFTVSLSNPSFLTVTVDVATADDTATVADGDYAALTQTVTFAPGETSKTVSVMVNGDTDDEPNETFQVALSNPSNATLAGGPATGTIADDDLAGALSIGNVTAAEGDTGATAFTFTVTLSSVGVQPVSVVYGTSPGTAGSADVQPAIGTLTFNPGETSKTVTVLVTGDTLDEIDETFLVDLTSPVNATIAIGQATGTITDDDERPTVSVADVTVLEGDSGTNDVSVVFTLSAASGRTVVVDYQSADGAAVAPGDYEAAGGAVTFQPGETTKSVTLRVVGDSVNEGNETFQVTIIGATAATVGDSEADVTITDDDLPGVLQFDRATYAVNEDAGTATITVTRTGGDAEGITVNYASSDGSATSGADYTSASGTLTFAAGETTKTFQAPIVFDNLEESPETVMLALSSPGGGATLGTVATAQLVINDRPHDPQERLVSRHYRGFLGRDAEPAGMAFYMQRLADGRMTRETMAHAMQNSPEYRENYIQGLYNDLLGRDSAGGIDAHLRGLAAGNSFERLRSVFLGSDEYFQRHGGTQDGFLSALFQDVLGRAIGPVGRATFSQALRDGMSRQEVALAVISSAESRQRTVERMYGEFLDRTATASEISFHADALRSGLTEKDLTAHFAASDEYFSQL
jgi:hypothetical protein